MNSYPFYQCAKHASRQPAKTRCPACRVLWSIESLQKKGELKVNPPVPAILPKPPLPKPVKPPASKPRGR